MTEVLRKAPEIIAIGQEHIPEHLKGHTLIFYIKEQDRVILAGWKEKTALLGKLITEYLELTSSQHEKALEVQICVGDPDLDLWRALEAIYQIRNKIQK